MTGREELTLDDLRKDLSELEERMKKVVPGKLVASIDRKCLLTPRRQTGRLDRRTNREPRWKISADHPDYASQVDANLVRLRLFIGMLLMRNAPAIDRAYLEGLSQKYFGAALPDTCTRDPLTDEELDFKDLVDDVVDNPKHGYSQYHIGHQDPRFHPKHIHKNVRWQKKASNDFQTTMDIRVARIASKVDQFTRTKDKALFETAMKELRELGQLLDVPDDVEGPKK